MQKVKLLVTEGGFHGLDSVERITPGKGIHRSPKKNEFVIDYDYIKSGGKNQGQAQSSRL